MRLPLSRIASSTSLVVLSSLVACGSETELQPEGEIYLELEGESMYFDADVAEVGVACEGLRKSNGDAAVESCLSHALIVSSRAVGAASDLGITVTLCHGLDEASSVDLGMVDATCVPSAVLVHIGRRVLSASSGSIDVALGEDADILVDAFVDDANDPTDEPIRVQAHLVVPFVR